MIIWVVKILLPRVRGQARWREETPPASEVSGGWEETLRIRGQGRPGGDTRRLRPGAAGRSHLTPEARGGDPEEPPQARGQGRQLGGATHVAGQSQWPGGASLGAVVAQAQEGLEELSHVEGQERQW